MRRMIKQDASGALASEVACSSVPDSGGHGSTLRPLTPSSSYLGHGQSVIAMTTGLRSEGAAGGQLESSDPGLPDDDWLEQILNSDMFPNAMSSQSGAQSGLDGLE